LETIPYLRVSQWTITIHLTHKHNHNIRSRLDTIFHPSNQWFHQIHKNCNVRTSAPDDHLNNYNDNLSDDCVLNPSNSNLTKIKIPSLNCCGLRSSGKRANFIALVDENNPDIICGCESHLDSQYYSAEIFCSTYTVFRKDREEGGGGVFLCIRDGLSVTEQPELSANAEIIWAKITLAKRNPIYICSFYRPPDSSTEPILQLQVSLNILVNQATEFPNIILSGDFNLPSINWDDGNGLLTSILLMVVNSITYF